MQPLLADAEFNESPNSPLHRSRSKANTSPMHKPTTPLRKCEFVGSISAVNEQLSKEGLLRQPQTQPLISELVSNHSSAQPSPCPGGSTMGHYRTSGRVTSGCGTGRRGSCDQPATLPSDQDSALVERYTFPGYSFAMVTPLPHHLDASVHMEMVTKAQMSFKTKPRFLKHWREFFMSPSSHDMFVDTFWWFFLQRYQPNSAVQDQLFARVAANYVQLLTNADQQYSDSFFKVYADVLAQCIYGAFIHTFPASWSSFDEEFKMQLCSLIYQWILGIKPLPDSWKTWNYEGLEPKNLMKHVSKKSNKKSSHTAKKIGSWSDGSSKQDKPVSSVEEHLPSIGGGRVRSSGRHPVRRGTRTSSGGSGQSCTTKYNQLESLALTVKGPEFEHTVMDVTSHSPLVQYFLLSHGLEQKQGSSLYIQHTDVARQPDPRLHPTYRKIVRESQQHSKEMKDSFDKSYKRLKEQMHLKEKERATARVNHQRNLTALMKHTREVKTLSNFLAVNQLCEQPDMRRKAKAVMVITDALKRVL